MHLSDAHYMSHLEIWPASEGRCDQGWYGGLDDHKGVRAGNEHRGLKVRIQPAFFAQAQRLLEQAKCVALVPV